MRPIDCFYEALGARIRERRDHLGYTQQELSNLVGLSRTSITNMERGRQRLMADQLLLMARALNTDVDKLLPQSSALDSREHRSRIDRTEIPTVAKFVEKAFAGTAAG